MTTPAGWYEAQGDPPGTVRYWDGTAWTTDPLPPPPGFDAGRAARDRFASVGVRIGASLIDGFVALAVSLPFLIGYISDILDDIDAGGDGTDIPVPNSAVYVTLLLTVGFFLMTAFLGGTPGKLALGLRITRDDGATTPPGLALAALRSLPGVAGVIPVIGPLISIVFGIGSLITVANDHERRSLYDRVAGTRVVRKNRL